MKTHPYAKFIWDSLMAEFDNEYGVAGLMGNLRAESGLYPDRVQGDVPYSDYSKEYTSKVDNYTISRDEFANNGPNGNGYGLAQWTFYTRKYALYDRWQSGGYNSIGDIRLACDFLIRELKNDFNSVYTTIKNASSIRVASDKVLHDFEAPADQSISVEVLRESLGQEVYDAFKGTSSTPSTPETPTPSKPNTHKLSKLLLYSAILD